MYTPRVSIPSREGTFERILAPDDLSPQLSEQNQSTFLAALIAWVSLLGDSPISDKKPNRVINTFINQVLNDPYGYILALSDAKDGILSSLDATFDASFNEEVHSVMRSTPIFREYLCFARTGDPLCLRFVLTFLTFMVKVWQDRSDLDTAAFRGWLQIEESMETLVVPKWVSNLRILSDFLLEDFEVDEFLPKHGPGSTADGLRSINLKNEVSAIPYTISHLFLRDGVDSENDDGLNSKSVLLSELLGDVENVPTSSLPSRLMFVPKDYKKTRSICMEPVFFQWAQQGVLRNFEQFFKRSPYLKHHIRLEDQTINQVLAQRGSITHALDTIDLSSASDSLSWDVVKVVFSPKVLKYLQATRSTMTRLPDGSLFRLRKFAPMGSALCFPVQSYIYSIVCAYIGICRAYGRDWEAEGALEGLDLKRAYQSTFKSDSDDRPSRLHPFSCYGDDIICDNRMTSNVVRSLLQLGFSVNIDKSFTGQSDFRESCGKWFYKGHDVTPFRLSLGEVGARMSIATCMGLVDNINLAREFGYRHLRRHLIALACYYPLDYKGSDAYLRKYGKNPILFSSNADDAGAILTDTVENQHLRVRRFSLDEGVDPACVTRSSTHILYQRDEVSSVVSSPKRKVQVTSHHYLYTLWWRSRYSGGGPIEDPTPRTADSLGQAVKWRWTAASA